MAKWHSIDLDRQEAKHPNYSHNTMCRQGTLPDMTERIFGNHALSELKELRRNPADGAKFYMALLGASFDFFSLADEVEQLEAVIEKLVSTLEAAAEIKGLDGEVLEALRETLSDPAIKKIIASS